MTPNERTLTVLLRQTQWALDAAARAVPDGRLTPEKAEELATILDDLAVLVRKHRGTVVIDAQA